MPIGDIVSIDSTGFHYADYPTVLEYYKDEVKVIYGADTYLEADSQDGQFIGIFAKAFYDSAAVFAGVFSSFSPALAQGDALSRNVAINGITRLVPTASTADIYIVGTAGTEITVGQMTDAAGYTWQLDNSPITIPAAGHITEAATCATLGAIPAAPNAINVIATPTRGWISGTNLTAATAGNPVETDAQLRYRQALSTMTTAMGVKSAMDAALSSANCDDFRVYENSDDSADGNGIPAHSICAVVVGGTDQNVINAIGSTKSLGCGTFGADTGTWTDENAIDTTINYTRADADSVDADIYIEPLAGWSTSTEALIITAITDYINALRIGDNVQINRMYPPAMLYGTDQFGTYNLQAIRVGAPGNLEAFDYVVPYNKYANANTISVITG